MRAAELAAGDPDALALIGPFRSRAVAEAVEATAPVGLPLLAPVATWAGVTRFDEPGAQDHPARHRGTVLRMVARDTAVAGRLAEDVRAAEQHAFVVAGEHEYGVQVDGQLDHVGLPRVDDPADADLVVLCGLAGGPEVARAARLGLPVIAFSGVEGEPAGIAELSLVLPFAPEEDMSGTTAAAPRGDADLGGRGRRRRRPRRAPLRDADRRPVRRARRSRRSAGVALPRGGGLVSHPDRPL